MSNDRKSGVVHFVLYKDQGDSLYTAVCLDFDIVEQGSDLLELKNSIEEAAKLHLDTVIAKKLPVKLLNRSAPKEYWKRMFELMQGFEKYLKKKDKNKEEPTVKEVWNRNRQELAAVVT